MPTPADLLPAAMRVAPAPRPLRIAVVYSRMPLPMTRADQHTVAHLIAYLSARGHSVDLFTLDTGEPLGEMQRRWLDTHCRKILSFPQGTVRSLLALAPALLRGLPLQVGWFRNRRQIAAVRAALATGDYDVGYAYYIRSAEALRGIAPAGATGRPATFLAMQLSQSLNTRRIAESSKRLRDRLVYSLERRLVRAYEARVWRDFSRTVLIGRRDVEEIRAACRERGEREIDNVLLCAHGVDIDRFRPRPDLATEPATIVFSGVMKTNTNINAVAWFVRECWPAVKAAVPAAKLLVVGRGPPPEIVALGERDGAITVTGEVADPADYIALATICINPMQAGAGMQNKLIEFMAAGKAVVATPLANEGIGASAGEHLVEAANATDFAREVVALLGDPARRSRLGQAARAYIERHWTWERFFGELEAEMLRASAPPEAADAEPLSDARQPVAAGGQR